MTIVHIDALTIVIITRFDTILCERSCFCFRPLANLFTVAGAGEQAHAEYIM